MSIDKNPDECITELESLKAELDGTECSFPIPDRDLLVHLLNNLSEKYGAVLDGLQGRPFK